MAKILGRVYIRVDGMTLSSIPGTGKLDPGGVERTPVMTDRGFVGYTEKPVHAEVEAEIVVDSETDIIKLGNTVEASITFEADSGQVFVIRNAACAMPIKPQAGDGKATVRFIGAAAEQA